MLNKELFALETVAMAILLSAMAWAGVEIFRINAAVAAIEVEQVGHNATSDTLGDVHLTLIRVEEGQKYLKKGVDRHSVDLKDLSNHVRELHLKE